ncbi:MAG: carotenoid biosynthesis protein [Candidatus Methanosuratincola petrocarbonis]|nr:carotenoid biosynthesis protein [Candidatus Methanosuratincola sp.]
MDRIWLLLASSGVVFLSSLTVVDFASIPEAGTASAIAVALFAAPSFATFIRWAGWKKGAMVLAVVGAAATAVEGISVVTGIPYGKFSYSDALGPLLLGTVPFALPLSYLPLLLGAVAVALRVSGKDRLRTTFLSAAILVGFDLALDPGAVAAGLWAWEDPGVYYGVPATNYLGWATTGLAYSAAMLILLRKEIASRGMPPGASASAILTLSFWTGYLFKRGYFLPGTVGAALIALVVYAAWFRAKGKRKPQHGAIQSFLVRFGALKRRV